MLRLINLRPLEKNSLGSSLAGPSADRDLVTVMFNVLRASVAMRRGGSKAREGEALSLPGACFLFVL